MYIYVQGSIIYNYVLTLLVSGPIMSIISEVTLRDVNKVYEPEGMNGSSSNQNLTKPLGESLDENIEEKPKKKIASLVDLPIEREGTENSGVEAANSEVEYIESENLEDVNDVDDCLKVAMFLFHISFANIYHMMLSIWMLISELTLYHDDILINGEVFSLETFTHLQHSCL